MASIHTIQTCLELTKTLQEVLSNPEAIRKAAEEAYSLGEKGEARVKEAYETIAKATETSEEIERKILDLKAVEIEVAKLRSDLKADISAHTRNVSSFETEKLEFYDIQEDHANSVRELAEQKRALDEFQKDLLVKEKEIEDRFSSLSSMEADIASKWDSVNSAESEFKAKAERFKQHTASFLE